MLLPVAVLTALAGAPEKITLSGDSGIRPVVGITAFLDVDTPTALAGNKFLFGAEYLMGKATGMAIVLGLHFGAGDQVLLINPIAEIHYRFDISNRIVPWIGGGLGGRLATSSQIDTNFGISARFVGGVDYFITSWAAITAEIVMPDIGIRVAPESAAIGTVEWIIGPHLRL